MENEAVINKRVRDFSKGIDIMQTILILPITYKIMNVRYSNYKYYTSGLKN